MIRYWGWTYHVVEGGFEVMIHNNILCYEVGEMLYVLVDKNRIHDNI